MSREIQARVDIQTLKEQLRHDCVMFLAFYLGEKLELEVPQLHEEVWDEFVKIVDVVNLNEWEDHLQKLFCVPRGFAKSTLTKLAVILFFRYSWIRFVLYASHTSNIAKAACADIIEWLCSERSQQVYGPWKQITANKTEQLWVYDIYDWRGRPKRVILKALGADQQVRGTLINNERPELLIIDDCEDNDTNATPETQAKLDTWLMGNLLKATARRSIRIMLGNMISKTTMLYRMSKDPEWNPTIYGAIIRNKETGQLESLWPAFRSLESLLKEYKDYRAKGVGHVWIYEMMNMTAEEVFKTGMENAVRLPRPNPDQVTAGVICLDPAFGKKKWHDQSALTVHVKVKDSGIPHVVESRKGRWNEDELLDEIVELAYYWNLSTVGIESVAGQQLFIPLFKSMLTIRGMIPEMFTFIPLPSGGVAKANRILSFVRSVSMGQYGVADEEDELLDALTGYDPDSETHEDLPDSAAYGPIAWSQEGVAIEEAGRLKEKLALLQTESLYESVHQSQLIPY